MNYDNPPDNHYCVHEECEMIRCSGKPAHVESRSGGVVVSGHRWAFCILAFEKLDYMADVQSMICVLISVGNINISLYSSSGSCR